MIDVKLGNSHFRLEKKNLCLISLKLCPPPLKKMLTTGGGILERVQIEEMTFLNQSKDALESCWLKKLKDQVEWCPRNEKEIYAKLENSYPKYMEKRKHKKGLCLENRSSKNDKKGAPNVELKPLPLHLRYEFLGPNQTFYVIISTKLNDAQTKKLL